MYLLYGMSMRGGAFKKVKRLLLRARRFACFVYDSSQQPASSKGRYEDALERPDTLSAYVRLPTETLVWKSTNHCLPNLDLFARYLHTTRTPVLKVRF
jgi:hypothetical protein